MPVSPYSEKITKTSQKNKSWVILEFSENFPGVVVLGDPSTDGTPIPPGQSSVEYEYECTSACTSQWEHEINVLYSELHMHKAGSMVRKFLWIF